MAPDFPSGRRSIRIEESEFRLADYRAFLAENAEAIATFEGQRQTAFDEERAEWQRRGEFDRVTDLTEEPRPRPRLSRSPTAPISSRRPSAAASGSCWSRWATK